ncbi:MAG: hypothetical protein VX916_01875, partial [Planctomycetota bacterium]|nr:hypothetical protein [Planctomycetota bacterium]
MTWIAVVLSCCAFLWGDEEPPLALVGGAMLSVDGDAESKTEVILIRDGVIEAVGTDIEVPYDARRVDVTGLYVSPVFQDGWMESDLNFLEHTKMQGVPVDVGRDALASMSVGERTGLAPERRAWEGLPTVLPEQGDHRSAGFGAVVVAPDGMILAGSGAALHLNGHPLRESHLDTDVAQFGSLSWRGGWGGRGENVYPSTLMGVMAHLRQVLLDASHRKDIADRNRSGRTTSFPVQDRVLLALEAVIGGEQPLILAVQTEEDIRLAIQLTEEFPGLRVGIAGGKEAWQVADLLAQKKIPVLLDLRFGDEPEQPGSKPKNKRASDSSRPEAESADSDQEETPKGADRPPPFDPGLPARVLRHRHDEWLENVAGIEVLFAAGVNVAFASMGRTAEELLKDLRVAVEKGALQEKHAMRALTSALDVVSGVDGE